MKLLNKLRRFWRTISHRESRLRIMFRLGQISERNKMAQEQPRFMSIPLPIGDAIVDFMPAVIDLAETPIPESMPAVPGERLAADRAKHGLNTIRLSPVPVSRDPFPWLTDDSWLNSKPQTGIYEPPEPETRHDLEAVRKRHERK